IPFLLTNGQLVNVALTSQTIGATTLTIPDFAGVVDEFTFKTKSQTLSNKTFVAPVLGAATGTSLSLSGNISATSWTTTGIAFNTTAATYTDTSTAGAGTVAIRTANSFSAPTFASTNAITVTNGFSLYVPKPIAGVNTTLTNANSAYFEGSVGINTTAPARKLDILDVNDVAQIRLTQTAATTYSELQTNSAGDLILSASGGDVRLQEGNLWVCSGGSCANADPAEHGNIIVETSVLLNNGFRLKQTGASTVDMYDSSGTNIILEFDEAQ
ncbi:MAG: hypothetical protein NT161_02370, partial [Candidatus Nomurabacteria bacterium]|nr:hypothetical protein [Candidatus Nomurabacteria bacterium]